MIKPLWKGIPAKHLPFVHPIRPNLLGARSDSSNFSVPEKGSYVIVKFEDSIYNPYYIGEIQSTPTHQHLFDEDYPETYGFRDKKNNWFKINKAKEYVEFHHSSGSKIRIEKDGTIYIKSVKDVVWDVAGDFYVKTSTATWVKR